MGASGRSAREGLLGPAQGGPRVYGVKSFEHAFDRLEERCHAVLDLIPAFEERYIRSDSDWDPCSIPRFGPFCSTPPKISATAARARRSRLPGIRRRFDHQH